MPFTQNFAGLFHAQIDQVIDRSISGNLLINLRDVGGAEIGGLGNLFNRNLFHVILMKVIGNRLRDGGLVIGLQMKIVGKVVGRLGRELFEKNHQELKRELLRHQSP